MLELMVRGALDPSGREYPDFLNPPIVEVALDVQFQPIKGLNTPRLGLLWQRFKSKYPRVEEHPSLGRMEERLGVHPPTTSSVHVGFFESLPLPRLWFLNPEGTELIQVQRDRFVHNWRKVGAGDAYPRYERIRETFSRELERFTGFLAEEDLGAITPDLCELTYINHIVSGAGWQDHGDIHAILAGWHPPQKDPLLPKPENASFSAQYVIADEARRSLGRLYVDVAPAFRTGDNKPMYVMRLRARGRPQAPGVDGALQLLDVGRDWIVRAFLTLTTSKMQRTWGVTA